VSEEISQGTTEISRVAEQAAVLMRRAHDEMDALRLLSDEIQRLVNELKNTSCFYIEQITA